MREHETVREIAEREALEAEAEQGDDEPDGDAGDLDEQEGQADTDQPPAPPTQKELEAAQRALDKENRRHSSAVAKIMGADFAELLECPCCQIPGFVFPFQAGTVHDEERRAAVEAYLGASGPNYVEATDRARCEACDGLGEVLSGSRNPLHRVVPCSPCGGLGWVQVSAQVAPLSAGHSDGYMKTAQPVQQTNGDVPDLWGRPPGHPHYGMAPAAVGL